MAKYAVTSVFKSKVLDIVKKLLTAHFGTTLDRETDIVNIVSALIQRESTYNPNAVSPKNSSRPGTGGGKYIRSSAIVQKLTSATPEEKANIEDGLYAMGLMQVLGSYFVKGGAASGVAELQRLRSDLAGDLLVDPGQSIRDNILGEANIEKAIKAGLIILEGKYKSCVLNNGSYVIPGDRYGRKFQTKMAGAISAYLGLGVSDVSGTTPESYARDILGGSAYRAANGTNPAPSGGSASNVQSAAGPATNGSNQAKLAVAGCQPPPTPITS